MHKIFYVNQERFYINLLLRQSRKYYTVHKLVSWYIFNIMWYRSSEGRRILYVGAPHYGGAGIYCPAGGAVFECSIDDESTNNFCPTPITFGKQSTSVYACILQKTVLLKIK